MAVPHTRTSLKPALLSLACDGRNKQRMDAISRRSQPDKVGNKVLATNTDLPSVSPKGQLVSVPQDGRLPSIVPLPPQGSFAD